MLGWTQYLCVPWCPGGVREWVVCCLVSVSASPCQRSAGEVERWGNRMAALLRRVSDLVVDVRRRFVSACAFRYPVVLDLHRFLFLLLLHPVVWSEGGLAKRRRVRVSAWCMPGFLVLLVSGGMVLLVGLVLKLSMLMLASGLFLLDFWLSFVISSLSALALHCG